MSSILTGGGLAPLSSIPLMEHISNIVMMLAACGGFLIGFKLLSDNMERIAGNSLKKLFNKTSNKKLVGVGIGAGATAVVQSSGVTTVMVVGFVNAGIMTLHQAASMIMGANIGTTITAQIAALGSSGGSKFDISILFISLLFIGVMMEMFFKKDKIKSIGLALAGLGLVFFGLDIMSGSMKVYTEIQEVQDLLSTLKNPFILLLFGIVFTALLNSSSAVTTVIIGMADVGLFIGGIDGGNAVLYVILGSNIGSCVTALLSSIGTSVNARRTSIIHLSFNVLGSALFMIMLLVWSKGVVGSDFYQVTFAKWFSNPATQIAMFHTFFNVTCTLLFLPFTNFLVKVSTFIVREKEQKEKEPWEFVYMDKRFLTTPTVALLQLRKETFRMADLAMESLRIGFNGFIDKDLDAIDKVHENNEQVLKLSEEISNYLVRVSASGISFEDEKEVRSLHNNIGDIGRVAELADNMTKYTRREVKDNLVFSAGINEKLGVMHDMLHEQYALVKQIGLENRSDLIGQSDELEDRIDNMRRELVAEHITRLSQGKCRPENNTVFINLVCNLERVGDHLSYVVHSEDDA
ncbi:MAG: Na/Pi cotransporter family protein [Clostridiales bacterium]|nr:Na/Pi cotransporter family protein [Clostridiales bacterium]